MAYVSEQWRRRRQFYCDILGLDFDASVEQIKRRYRQLARKFHPDALRDLSDKERRVAEEQFKLINEAHEFLTSPEEVARFAEYEKKKPRAKRAKPPPEAPRAERPEIVVIPSRLEKEFRDLRLGIRKSVWLDVRVRVGTVPRLAVTQPEAPWLRVSVTNNAVPPFKVHIEVDTTGLSEGETYRDDIVFSFEGEELARVPVILRVAPKEVPGGPEEQVPPPRKRRHPAVAILIALAGLSCLCVVAIPVLCRLAVPRIPGTVELSEATIQSATNTCQFTATVKNTDSVPHLFEVSADVSIRWTDGEEKTYPRTPARQQVDVPPGDTRAISFSIPLGDNWDRPLPRTSITPRAAIVRTDPPEIMAQRATATAYVVNQHRIAEAVTAGQLTATLTHSEFTATKSDWLVGFVIDASNATQETFTVDLLVTFRFENAGLDPPTVTASYTLEGVSIPPSRTVTLSEELEMCRDVVEIIPEEIAAGCSSLWIAGWNPDQINGYRLTIIPEFEAPQGPH